MKRYSEVVRFSQIKVQNLLLPFLEKLSFRAKTRKPGRKTFSFFTCPFPKEFFFYCPCCPATANFSGYILRLSSIAF